MQDAALAVRLEVAAHDVADLDRRLGQIDSTIEEAAKRGRTTTALTAIEALRKTREVLAAQRQREGKALADLSVVRSGTDEPRPATDIKGDLKAATFLPAFQTRMRGPRAASKPRSNLKSHNELQEHQDPSRCRR
jgi:hypothetical protein